MYIKLFFIRAISTLLIVSGLCFGSSFADQHDKVDDDSDQGISQSDQTQNQTNDDESKNSSASEQNFVPTEKISADDLIPFPVDI